MLLYGLLLFLFISVSEIQTLSSVKIFLEFGFQTEKKCLKSKLSGNGTQTNYFRFQTFAVLLWFMSVQNQY